MIRYCEDIYTCRRVMMLEHFGEKFNSSQCGKSCDTCIDPVPSKEIECSIEIKKIATEMDNLI